MAGNPLIQLGTLNRLIGSVTIPNFPELNVIAAFLGRDGMSLSLRGDTTLMLEQMAAAVTSPEPYQLADLRINLVRTTSLPTFYKDQMESTALIGDVTVRLDTPVFPVYQLVNCAIQTVDEITINGQNAGWVVHIGGTYYINNDLWG